MNNKIKSLIYLGCFMLAAVTYHLETGASNNEEPKKNKEVAQADIVIQPFTEHLTAEEVQ
ncbi:hypothetical protein J8L85_15200 [Maribacter sp. MMG018]|uniref:hypothetical protein n=1 Tax=Maribacter sp. MMG018 TaxID=2822688 RepID=UPI001B38914C|nr:hypothetical protein [Maribacter sp. MMG018]MBQ4915801.1 hypothetical protein [Maribacter sp. MMG018]